MYVSILLCARGNKFRCYEKKWNFKGWDKKQPLAVTTLCQREGARGREHLTKVCHSNIYDNNNNNSSPKCNQSRNSILSTCVCIASWAYALSRSLSLSSSPPLVPHALFICSCVAIVNAITPQFYTFTFGINSRCLPFWLLLLHLLAFRSFYEFCALLTFKYFTHTILRSLSLEQKEFTSAHNYDAGQKLKDCISSVVKCRFKERTKSKVLKYQNTKTSLIRFMSANYTGFFDIKVPKNSLNSKNSQIKLKKK